MKEQQKGRPQGMRVDLHVHSKHSTRPSQWVLQKLNCPESYTEPRLIYERAKRKGMDLVTISDHNSLAGSLEIAHLEDTFLSEEITTYFPTDRCKIHVLALDITEEQHLEIQKVRENVYDLARYLHHSGIVHVVAHPLYDINHLLSWSHVEQLLLLFQSFELNGSREAHQNAVLRCILQELNRASMERMADKHDLAPLASEPWKKSVVGGSDDHSSLNIARLHTFAPQATSKDEFFRAVLSGQTRIYGKSATPRTMAHNLYGIAYQFYKDKFRLERAVGKDAFMQFADAILTGKPLREESLGSRLTGWLSSRKTFQKLVGRSWDGDIDILLSAAREKVVHNPDLKHRVRTDPGSFELEDDWFDLVNEVSGKVSTHFADSVIQSMSGARLFNIFHSLGSAGTIYTLLAPYFLSYAIFCKDREFGQLCLQRFRQEAFGTREASSTKLAVFTDTFQELNGVALTLQQQLRVARSRNIPYFVLTCGQDIETEGAISFPSQGSFQLPEYPEQELHYPPFLEMLHFCYEKGFTHILSSTPGPVGLAALGIARILKLPIYATYHTALPQYVLERTQDRDLEELVWKGMLWYYNQMDNVFVPSQVIATELVERGLSRDKVSTYPRGIDTEKFHPAKRNGFWGKYFADSSDKTKIVYVGRVSKEKNLDVLTKAYRQHLRQRRDLKLIVVGSGPYLSEMQAELAGESVLFTGELHDEDLAQAYASSDIFVFPSGTDTFGNVVLEAQASGLPVIVSDQGGPQENMRHNETGFVVPVDSPRSLAEAVLQLADDPALLARMKEAARGYCRDRSFETAFLDHWAFYTQPCEAV